jgi:hypothetical protein
MQPIPLEPGMRVRCVRADHYAKVLREGKEYTVSRVDEGGNWVWVDGLMGYHLDLKRFKPIVRVKAKCVPSLSVLIKRAVAAVERMTPAERAAMDKAQRESWARGEAGMGID